MGDLHQTVETFYRKVYETLRELHEEAAEIKEDVEEEELAVSEKIERTEFALQLSRDVLENFVDSGKIMTINYDDRAVTIEVDSK
ncbi:hypothetical protein GCM10010954_22960 [Halobacillus andaensis]|uniref:Uncharacterized protein n=1 Tax=Halobacillus andaensis TaxID=1176239 RepID=A0A917B4R8_HALAA|nr:hypothetical protein [Halobacillus andaensis]MBP2006113.1 putative house-cleaning noncanonical NTP pyrophosphatase (MazG superfamily) [Halobacillus andaensis]GGF23567.1 hypothetical protein GCM10010954_22960 [Halobacillus andaensis]